MLHHSPPACNSCCPLVWCRQHGCDRSGPGPAHAADGQHRATGVVSQRVCRHAGERQQLVSFQKRATVSGFKKYGLHMPALSRQVLPGASHLFAGWRPQRCQRLAAAGGGRGPLLLRHAPLFVCCRVTRWAGFGPSMCSASIDCRPLLVLRLVNVMPAGILLSLGSCSPHCRRGLLGGAGRSARRQPLPERRVWLAPALAPPSAAGAARGTAHGGLGAAGLARGFTPSNLEWAGLAHDSSTRYAALTLKCLTPSFISSMLRSLT